MASSRLDELLHPSDNSAQMGRYDVAQICLNGHVINAHAASQPAHNSDFCAKCGTKTITTCLNCSSFIPGKYRSEVIADWTPLDPPAYCRNCGKAFPWTGEAIEAARLLTDEVEGLSLEDREQLKATFPDLIADTPRTVLAATRFRKISAKASRTFVDTLRQLLVDIASETAKKIITGP